MGRIRSAAKALIVRDARLLLLHCRDETGDWYALPGGGQEVGESLAETCARECREEIGAEVEVGRLLFVRDHVAAHHAFTYLEEAPHQVEHLFECRVPASYEPRNGPGADTAQVGVVWLSANDLVGVRVYPERLREVLTAAGELVGPTYWGDVQ